MRNRLDAWAALAECLQLVPLTADSGIVPPGCDPAAGPTPSSSSSAPSSPRPPGKPPAAPGKTPSSPTPAASPTRPAQPSGDPPEG
ncbi:hypothetical protein GCM10023205_30970 [Yinghuangia aomiensis]|uniref:Uncharacterized protein n=1 Tax=Yinghuangia aomiensis TaxID=676205 RepID=A0ABP9H9H0_9ACTN